MLKMQEVYRQNPALGDANGPEILKKINENAQKLNDLQSEYKKFQVKVHPNLSIQRFARSLSVTLHLPICPNYNFEEFSRIKYSNFAKYLAFFRFQQPL